MAKDSKTVSAGSRIYYFDARKTKKQKTYYTITEMSLATGKRHCIYVYPEDAEAFAKAFCEIVGSLNVGKR